MFPAQSGLGQAMPTAGSEEERQLLLETGLALASAGCNYKALEVFGLQWMTKKHIRECLADIRSLGLPLHTAPEDKDLEENNHLISSLLPRDPSSAPRRLLLSFDRTYLQPGTQICTTSRGNVLSGGPHRCAGYELEDESHVVLKHPDGTVVPRSVARDRAKASEMESVVMWDPSRKRTGYYEIGAYPVMPAAERHPLFEQKASCARLQRGQFETLMRLGAVLDKAVSVKHIVCDRHGSHGWLAALLYGKSIPLCKDLFELLPFFPKLVYEDLPSTPWPCPYRIATISGSSIHFYPGGAHSQKAFCEQLRSPLTTPHWGHVWCDLSGGLELGLLPVAYSGTDAMSDKQAAMLLLV